MMPRIRPLLLYAVLGLLAAGSAGARQLPVLRWRGDYTTAKSLAEGLAAAWARSGGGRLDVDSFNTISGIDQAIAGKVDIAGSARPPFAGQPQESRLVFTPLAWDALVLVTRRGNPVHDVTLQQLYQIYLGYMTRWNQLGGPDRAIHLYSIASPLDGVEFDLRRFLYGRGDQEIAAPRLYLNTQQLQVAVGLDPQALAVTAYSNVYRNPGLQMLSVEGVRPDARTIADGRYPLLVPLYFATNPRDPDAAEVQRFMRFAEGPGGQAVIRARGMVPWADGTALQAGDALRRQWVAARLAAELSGGRVAMNGPLAAAGATDSQGAGITPAAPAAQAAKMRMQQRDAQRKAADRAAEAQSGGSGEGAE